MSQLLFSMAASKFNKNRGDFYKDLGVALEEKSDLLYEIGNLHSIAKKRKQTGATLLYEKWLRRLDNGMLMNTINEEVPTTDIMLIGAYEKAGKLSEGLKFLSKTLELTKKMSGSIKMAVIGPSMLTIMLAGILSMHAFLLTPVLLSIMEVKDWTVAGRMLYPLAMTVKHYGIYIAGFIITAVTLFSLSLKRWKGPMRAKLDNYLPYSIYRDYNGALFLTSLAALMKAGNGMMESLKELSEMSSPWMQWHIREMITRIDRHADEPAMALNTGLIPLDTMDRIVSYARRSSFLEAMANIGMESMSRTEENISSSAKKVNSIMLIIVGVVFILIISGTVSTGLAAQDVIRSKM